MTVARMDNERVNHLLRLAARLNASEQFDPEAFEGMRKHVAAALQGSGDAQLIEKLRAAEVEPGVKAKIERVIGYCREHFHEGSTIYSAVAVPIGVKADAERDGLCEIARASSRPLREMSEYILGNRLGLRVTFDTLMYTADGLMGADAKAMRNHLLCVDSGSFSGAVAKTTSIKPAAESSWQMVYLLGVMRSKGPNKLALAHPEVRDKVLRHRSLFEYAIAQTEAMFTHGVEEPQAKCVGLGYLADAVRQGNLAMKDLKLRNFIDTLDGGATGVKFYYTIDTNERKIRLLSESSRAVLQHVWDLTNDEHEIAMFKRTLEAEARSRLPEDDVLGFYEVDGARYATIARRFGIIW